MEYANLNNGVKMPMAGIGTFLLTPDEAEASCVSALQDGYRLIDTANAYVNEKAVGRAMKKSGLQREEIFLETKLWPSFYEQPDAVDKTLARLDTPYIDLLFEIPHFLRRRICKLQKQQLENKKTLQSSPYNWTKIAAFYHTQCKQKVGSHFNSIDIRYPISTNITITER